MPNENGTSNVGNDSPKEVVAFPAAMSQEAFHYLEGLRGEAAPFNIAVRFRLEGTLDVDLLKRAFDAVIERHESLRTQFEDNEGELFQIVQPAAEMPFQVLDISNLSKEAQDRELQRIGLLDAQKPFDLKVAPLIRACLVRLSPMEHILHVSVHHGVADGWSIGILVHEVAALYDAFEKGQPSPLAPLQIQYGDFAVWQRDFLAGPDVLTQLDYWKKRLHAYVEPELLTDKPRPAVKRWGGDIVSELLSVELTDSLKEIAQENGATLFHVFLAAFDILLHRYTGSVDIGVGTPLAGRNRPELEPIIGTFINSVILRVDLSGNPGFPHFLKQVRDAAVDAVANQDIPFESLVRELKPPRDPSRNPLFQVNFTHQRDFVKPVKFGDVSLVAMPSLSPGAIFDLHFFMVERDGVWRASCDFSTDLFTRETALRMLGHFRRLLESIALSPNCPIDELSMLAESEVLQLADWSGRLTEYPSDETIGSLFLKSVAKYPEKPALVQGRTRITYRQLHNNAAQLSQTLKRHGIAPGEAVVIISKPSCERIVAMLAIVMAGGTYVPMDPEYPRERIQYLLKDVRSRVAIADAAGARALSQESCEIIAIPSMDENAEEMNVALSEISSTQPAYVMYTSGSTGEPKGVVIPHRAILRLVHGDFIKFGPDEVFLQSAPLTFDASTLEIWGALLHGASLVIPDSNAPSLADFARNVREQRVTSLWLTAGLFQIMAEEHLDDLQGVKNLLAGGDVLPISQVCRALEKLPGTRLINGYGPTENTTFTACHPIDVEDLRKSSIPIGRPIANTSVWILDNHGRQVPIGVSGEILTGGDGLALGYLNKPQLTSEKFVPSPVPGRNGERVYHTGDLGCWRADGTIEFLGRLDRQVKVRGFRVEPGEVEAVLSSHSGVGQCKVAVRGNTAGEKSLVAWISPSPGAMVDRHAIRKYLAEKLPAHLRPDTIILLESFPLTPNGKVDIDLLPFGGKISSGQEAPISATEIELAAVWCELLGLSSVGMDDSFFDVGGHSLLGLRLFSRIRSDFGVTLPLTMLLQASTVRALAKLIDEESGEKKTEDPGEIIATIQEGGHLRPFFCVHGGDGRVMIYRHLAEHLDPNRPVFGIESPDLYKSDAIRIGHVEKMAADYLPLLRKRQPHGPYFLGGFSFGGVVAYEMARLLVAAGERVDFLALFDTMNPNPSRSWSARLKRLWKIYMAAGLPARIRGMTERVEKFWNSQSDKTFLRRLKSLMRRIYDYLMGRVQNKEGVFAPRFAQAHSGLRGSQLVRAYIWNMRKYHPTPYPGKLTLFKIRSENEDDAILEDYGWRKLAKELDIVIVPGEHLTLFDPDHVEALGAAVRQRLRAFDA